MLASNPMLFTAAALLLGGLIWLGLFWRRQKQAANNRSLFLVVLAAGILCRLAFIFGTPTFHAPDEQSHFNYVKYLAVKGSFPIQTTKMGDAANEWEYFQPPLYYLALLPVYRVAEALFHDPAATVLALRGCGLLLWLLNVWLGVVLLRRLRIEDAAMRLLVLGLVCLLPTYAFVSSVINNDNLLATLGGGVMCLLARREASLKDSLGLGVLLGLALLTKQSAVVFLPGFVLLVALDCRGGRMAWRVGLRHVGLVLLVAGVIFAPWLVRNWRVYGTLSPEHLSAAELAWPSMLHGLASAGHNLVKTFWAVSGISNNVGYPFPLVGMALMGMWVFGHHTALQRAERFDALNIKMNAPVVAALWLAVLVAVVLVLRFGYLFGMGQGRHLFPLLYAVALLLAGGWRLLPVRHLDVHAAGFWITYGISFTVFSLCHFPR